MSSQTAVAAEKPCHEKQKTNKVTKQNIQTKMGKKKPKKIMHAPTFYVIIQSQRIHGILSFIRETDRNIRHCAKQINKRERKI